MAVPCPQGRGLLLTCGCHSHSHPGGVRPLAAAVAGGKAVRPEWRMVLGELALELRVANMALEQRGPGMLTPSRHTHSSSAPTRSPTQQVHCYATNLLHAGKRGAPQCQLRPDTSCLLALHPQTLGASAAA